MLRSSLLALTLILAGSLSPVHAEDPSNSEPKDPTAPDGVLGRTYVMLGGGYGLEQFSSEIAGAATFIAEAPGAKLLLARVLQTDPCAYKRNMDPAECRSRFKQAYAASV